MKNDEEHLAMLLNWRNRIMMMRILAGPSNDIDDLLRMANKKINQLTRQHKESHLLDAWA
ncbi:hypothetical protein [Schleiferilactobacillus perolens]|jgi:hypothetical protein|uniref:hypothetical protein n=1 Tax=Schleiferilactobacillus perolens TaxID=100468 RepID=UPI0039E91C1C